jgi:4-hydroxy-tetrahydrodipicolinate reductase
MTKRRRLALIGLGKMGQAVEALAPLRDWEVVARIRADDNRDGSGINAESLNGADVAIEFTEPAAARDNIRAAVIAGCPVVVGTTGWLDDLPDLGRWVAQRHGALLTATNFSLGVNAFEQIVSVASQLLQAAGGFDAHLIETHHAGKKDAPSGTAMTLQRAAARGWQAEIPITSVRTGSVPGTHELLFDAPFESVRLTHIARDRRVFAEGALVAASWLIGREGVFTMRDVLMTRAISGES